MTFPSIIFSALTAYCSLTSHYFGYAIEVSGSSQFGTAARTKRLPVSVSSKLGVCQVIMSTPTVLSSSKPSNAYPRSLRGFSFLLPDLLTRRTGGLSLIIEHLPAITPASPRSRPPTHPKKPTKDIPRPSRVIANWGRQGTAKLANAQTWLYPTRPQFAGNLKTGSSLSFSHYKGGLQTSRELM